MVPSRADRLGQGEKFSERPWSQATIRSPTGVRSSIYVNLLTEDNLPYYTHSLLVHAPKDHPIRDWNHQWTMEENRHAMVMRDWVHISRCIDPTLLEEGRRVQMGKGEVPEPETIADLITYVSFQERATQIAHRNTGAKLPKDDKIGRNVLALVAGDETKHYLFYRDLALAAFAIDPSTMMIAAAKQVSAFAMPGTGIPSSPVTRCASRERGSTGSASSCRRARSGPEPLGRRPPRGPLRGGREGSHDPRPSTRPLTWREAARSNHVLSADGSGSGRSGT